MQLIQQVPGLLQSHYLSWLLDVWVMGHFLEPPQQLLNHFPVVLPLSDQAVNDASPLLSSPHNALPLIAEQGQLHTEVVSVGSTTVRSSVSSQLITGS